MNPWALSVDMASDEEIERQVRQHEQGRAGQTGDVSLQEYRETASEIHDELARRIQDVDETAAAEEDLTAVVEKLERLEIRLEDLEERL